MLVTCIILEFNTTYCVFPIIKRIAQILPLLILILLILLNNKRVPKTWGYIAIYMMGCIFPLLTIGNDKYVAYCFRYIMLLPLLWFYLSQQKETNINAYLSLPLKLSNVITVIAIISIVMWLLCSIMAIIPTTFMIPYDWTPGVYFIPSYYNIYFETQHTYLLGQQVWRNSGIFNEAPMHNMILCTAFAIEYFIRPQKSKLRISILTFAIISTFTTTGQLFLIAITGWHIYKNIGKRYRPLLIIVTPIILGIIYIMRIVEVELLELKAKVTKPHRYGTISLDSEIQQILSEKGKRILIIDDCIDTGWTLKLIKEYLENNFPDNEIKIAVFTTAHRRPIIKADFQLYNRTLIRFPWAYDAKSCNC